jgi:NTP pyrophosphatase (non-canonical NTP hydrolase)
MLLTEYVELAMKTDNKELAAVKERLEYCPKTDIESVLANVDKYAQLTDGIKKYLMYGKEPKGAKLTTIYDNIGTRLSKMDNKEIRMFHAILGLITESQELLEGFCKGLGTEEGIDEVNLAEELGDLGWYQALLVDSLQVSWEDQLVKNINKLKARYGDKFTEEQAITRNLVVERAILEGEAE